MRANFLRHLQYEKRVSAHTFLAYQSDLEQFESFLASHYPDGQMTSPPPGAIRAWIISLTEKQHAPTSVNRKIACLRSFFKYLLKQGVITSDPMMKVRMLKTGKRLPVFLQEKEVTALLDDQHDQNDFVAHRNHLMLQLFYGAGVRLSELLQLKESNVDLRNAQLRVLGKRNKERIIPFPAGIVSVIKQYLVLRNRQVAVQESAAGLLFVTGEGAPCYPMMVYRIVNESLRQVTQNEKKSPHVLRHTYATHLLNKGAEINAVKDLLGHSSLAATQVYTHNSMEKLKKAFDQAHPKA